MQTQAKSPCLIALPCLLIFFYWSPLKAQIIVHDQTKTQQASEEPMPEPLANPASNRSLVKKQKLIDKNLKKGFSLASKEENNKAIAKYEKVLELDPSNSNAYYNLALLYAKSDQTLKAINFVDKALTLVDDDNDNADASDLYLLKANCLSDMDEYKKALPFYEKSLSIDPGNLNAHYNLGYTYFQLGQWQDAIAHFDQYIKIGNDEDEEEEEDSDYTAALSYTGQAYFQLKQYQKAIEYYDFAIQKNPEYRYFLLKVDSLKEMNRDPEVLVTFKQALTKHPKAAVLYHQRYQFHRDKNRLEEAYIDLKKAFALEPENTDYIFDMGVMYQKNNQMEQAIAQYEKCIAQNKYVDQAYGNMATIYSKSELTLDKAFDYYKKATKNLPFDKDPQIEQNEHSLIGEASEYIKALLKLLPDEYAIPLYMYDLEGIDQKTISENLNLSLPNTKSRIQRGRVKLKERFLECCSVVFDEQGEMVSFDIKPQCKELQAEKKRLENIF